MSKSTDTLAAPTPAPPRSGRAWQVLLPAWFLGLVFVVSAVSKMYSLGAFELYVVQQQILPSRELAAYAVRLLLAAELALGLLCFQRAWFRRFTLPATFLMLFGFSLWLAYLAFIKKETGSCHCFGELLEMSPLHSLFKNLALLVIVVYLYRRTRDWAPGSWRMPAGLVVAGFLLVGGFCPIRHIAVQPAPQGIPAGKSQFAKFRDFSGGRTANLTQGTCLVAFVSLECDHCQALVTRLAEVARDEALPPLYLLCLGEAKDAPAFLKVTSADFPFACIDPRVFYDFIGEWPPRLYLLQDGQVRKYWDGEEFDPQQLAPWWHPE